MGNTKKHRFVIIEPNHTELAVQERAEPFALKEMQEAVGGYVEAIPLVIVSADAACAIIAVNNLLKTERFYVFANEDGRRLKQKPNPLASAVLGVELLGPVLVCSDELIEKE